MSLRTIDSVVVQPAPRMAGSPGFKGFKVLLHYAEAGQDLWHSQLPFDDAIRIGRQMAWSHNVPLVVDETR